ncbi:MAG: hypothetical protein ACT4N1_05145 [Nitrososphaerota archaeon]
MVLIWIGIGVGTLTAIALIYKIIKSKKGDYISIRCKKCGIKTNGLKCPVCESEKNRVK